MNQPYFGTHIYTADFSALTAYILSSVGALSPAVSVIVGVLAGLYYLTALYKEWF